MKILIIISLLLLPALAGCQRQEADIDALGPAGEIPNRPGIIESTTGKKLEIGIL